VGSRDSLQHAGEQKNLPLADSEQILLLVIGGTPRKRP
jgi:hypothetical protein